MSQLPETILQFGGGRFLRAFADRFVQHANDAGAGVGKIVVVQSTPGPRADLLNQQKDGYHVIVRGYEDGELVDRVENIRSISRALVAANQWDEVLQLARSPELKYILSNGTESSYVLDSADQLDSSPAKSLPGKFTQVLWARFQAKQKPALMLPCELIENNAEKLLDLVLTQSRQWQLPEDFQNWISKDTMWLASLVDCIVTNGPKDHELAQSDQLLACAEPYALWALQKPANGEPPMFEDPAIHIVDDLAPFYLRKVRMLNGTHTAMVAKFLPAGFTTVQEVLGDKKASRWVRDLLFEEIVPTLAYRLESVAEFADQVYDRFRNPFQAHKLQDIALNHDDKLRIRLQPTHDEYQKLFGKIPQRLAEVLASQGKIKGPNS